MPARPDHLLDQVRRTMASAAHGTEDAVLLERFVRCRDEGAFAALVDRHGPMVYRLCRRLLSDGHAAEDAFQATFLVLARKAAVVQFSCPVAAWLYAVARRVALKASGEAHRRRKREQSPFPREAVDRSPGPPELVGERESLALFDEGLQRLPEHQRLPLVLCCLEGRTCEEAARLLGCTAGSVKGRLERGRVRLHAWLVRRGLTLGGVLVAAAASRAGVRADLAGATVRIALQSGVAPGTISTAVNALANEGVRGMVCTKSKMAVILALTLGLTAGGGAIHLLSAKKPDAPAKPGAAKKERPKQAEGEPLRVDAHGDPLPAGAVGRLGTVRFRHEGEASSLVYSPDGKTLAAKGWDGVITLWDARTGAARCRIRTHFACKIAYSPDSTIIASLGDRKHITFWDAATGDVVKEIVPPDGFIRDLEVMQSGTVRFSPDGKLLALGGWKVAYILDVKAGKVVHQFTEHINEVVAFSSDGQTLALKVRNGKDMQSWEVQIRSVRTWKILRRLEGHTSYDGAIAFSPDGKRMAGGGKKALILWDVPTGKARASLDIEGDAILHLQFTPDSKTLLSCHQGSAGKVRAWNAATGKEQRQFDPRMWYLRSMAVSPDGKTLAVGGVFQTIRLLDLATGRRLITDPEGHDAQVNGVAYSPDGKLLASAASSGQVWIWDAKTGKPVRELPGASAHAVRFSPDGRRIAILSLGSDHFLKTVHVADASTVKELFRLPLDDGRRVSAMAYSPDGKQLITADWIERNRQEVIAHLNVWDAATGKSRRRLPIAVLPYCLAIAPDGNTLAVGSVGIDPLGDDAASDRSKRIRLWDLRRGEEILSMFDESDMVISLAFSPSGRTLVSGSRNFGVRLWEVATGKEIARLGGTRGNITVAFSPDGRIVASGADVWRCCSLPVEEDNRIRLWDVATGVAMPSLVGHHSNVTSLAFSPDGSRLASGLRNSTVVLWEVPATAKGAAPLRPGEAAAFWADLAGDDAGKAHTAGWKLSTAATVPFLSARLKPATAPDAKQLRKLIADLDADRFAVRQSASEELARWGHSARLALLEALDAEPPPESRKRLERLLAQTRVLTAGEELRGVRAVEVLERIATPAARSLLQRLAEGAPEARLTQEAKASSRRLAGRSAAEE